jgi:hypothetical protein
MTDPLPPPLGQERRRARITASTQLVKRKRRRSLIREPQEEAPGARIEPIKRLLCDNANEIERLGDALSHLTSRS